MKVELFTREGCGGCEEARRQFDEAGVDYEEVNCDTADGLARLAWLEGEMMFPQLALDGVISTVEEVLRAHGGQ